MEILFVQRLFPEYEMTDDNLDSSNAIDFDPGQTEFGPAPAPKRDGRHRRDR